MEKQITQEVSEELLQSRVYFIRKKKVMFDRDLAALYGVETRVHNTAVKRNLKRFPVDFMFRLNQDETDHFSRSQIEILNDESRSQIVTLKRGLNIKYLPYVFTEQGVAMLSSVLNSERAVQVNIQIMRMFTKLREMILTNEQLSHKIEELEKEQEGNFKEVFKVLRFLLKEDQKPKQKIGFKTQDKA